MTTYGYDAQVKKVAHQLSYILCLSRMLTNKLKKMPVLYFQKIPNEPEKMKTLIPFYSDLRTVYKKNYACKYISLEIPNLAFLLIIRLFAKSYFIYEDSTLNLFLFPIFSPPIHFQSITSGVFFWLLLRYCLY